MEAQYKATAKSTGNRDEGLRYLIIGLKQLTSYIKFNDPHAFCENPKIYDWTKDRIELCKRQALPLTTELHKCMQYCVLGHLGKLEC